MRDDAPRVTLCAHSLMATCPRCYGPLSDHHKCRPRWIRRALFQTLVTFLFILIGLLACGSSALWLQRDFSYVSDNVSRTTVHPVYLSKGDAAIIEALAKEPGRKVVLAKPGSWNPLLGPEFRPIPDAFGAPLTPDLNAVASGLAGAYTYAGHWSETPEYAKKREEISIFFSPTLDDAQRASFAKQVKATHLIAPKPTEQLDLSRLGKTIIQGDRFDLVRLP